MTHVGPAPVVTETAKSATFVEWSAVLAGGLVAASLSFVFLTFGTAIGLFATSPWPNSGISAKLVVPLAVFFVMVQQIGAFMAGGYVAGRMRARWSDPSSEEADFRDGLHGGLVWALGVAIGAMLTFSAAGAAAKAGANLAAPVAGAAANQGMDALLDTMLRPTVVAQATTPTTPPPTGPATTPTTLAATQTGAPQTPTEARAEIGRIMASAIASGELTADNKAYVAQVIGRRAGLSQQEAERRIDVAMANAREAADKARRASMLTALVTGISLIVAFGAAWWAAVKGGNHRDQSIPARFSFAPPRRVPSA